MTGKNTEKTALEKEQTLLALVQGIAAELHPGLSLGKISLNSSLDREAGIDSLGRIELLARIESVFGVVLPEELAIGAERIIDLYHAIEQSTPAAGHKWEPALVTKPVAATDEIPGDARTLTDLLDWHMEHHPDKIHLRLFETGADEAVPVTYGELYRNALQVAGGLHDRGIIYGDKVGIMLPTSLEYLSSFFGILFAGGVPVPIYPPQRMSRIEEHLKKQLKILDNAQARLLIAPPDATRLGPLLKSGLPELREVTTYQLLTKNPGPARRVPVNEDDTAFIQYTSGSTGNPKGVVLSHANLLANIRAMGKAVGATPADVYVSWLPLYHDMGLIGAWFGALYYNMELVLMSPLGFMARPVRWLRAIHQYRGTLSAAPNFAYELCSSRISDEDLAGLDLSSWRRALNGAEPVLSGTIEIFQKKFAAYGLAPEAIAPVYGLAENSVGLLFPPAGRGPRIDLIQKEAFYLDREAVPAPGDEDALRFVSCGSVIPDHEVRIVDRNDRIVGERSVGKLQFRGPSATAMYCRNPEATKLLFHGDWLDTGDYAYEADGEIYITGREKELIIRGGRNIYPYELEQVIGEIKSVRKGGVAVFGSIDPQTGAERLIVLAEVTEKRPDRLERIRQDIMDASVNLVQIPPDDIVLAELRTVLKTSSGKIRRATCKQLYESGRLGRKKSVWLQVANLVIGGLPGLFRRYYKRTAEYSFALYEWLLFALMVPPTWFLVVISPWKKLRFHIIITACRLVIFLSGIRFTVSGRENLTTERPLIIVSNHQSYLDSIFMFAAMRQPLHFVAKGELKNNFFARIFLNRIEAMYVERFDPKGGIGDVRGLAEETGLQKYPIVFFAEGTFSDLPGLRPFRMGAFVIAASTGAAMLPVSLQGARVLLRGDDFFPKKSTISVMIQPAVKTAKTDWSGALELRESVRAEILKYCGEKDLGDKPVRLQPPGTN